MRFGFAIIAVISLAACDANEPAAVDADIGLEAAADAKSDPPSAETAVLQTIPARFHGVWDYVEGTCARESDLRTEITGGEVMFYESFGTVTSVTADGDDVMVVLALEGEGYTWDEQILFSLTNDGSILVLLSDRQKEAGDTPLPRKRCGS
ncbi:MAG: hypothetical protein ABJN35_07315 [Erythrobacter sp.]